MVLVQVSQNLDGLRVEDTDDNQVEHHLAELLRRVSEAVHEFSNVIRKVQDNDRCSTKFSWKAWIQNASRLRRLSEELKTARLEMNSTLTMIVAYARLFLLRSY